MFKFSKGLITVIAGALALSLFAGQALAQERQPVSSMSELLQRIRNDSALKSRESQERLARFRRDVSQQQALLNRAQGELNALRARERENAAAFETLKSEIGVKRAELEEKLGDLSELFGVTRQAAKTFRALLDESLTTAEYGKRTAFLKELAESEVLPTVEQLQGLWRVPAQELIAQAQVSKFSMNLAEQGERQAVRVGPFFIGLEGGEMAYYLTDLGKARQSTSAAPARVKAAIDNVFSAGANEVVLGPVDLAFGGLVRTEELRPNLQERIGQGGNIGSIIVLILIVGVILGILKFVALLRSRMSLAGQASKPSRPG